MPVEIITIIGLGSEMMFGSVVPITDTFAVPGIACAAIFGILLNLALSFVGKKKAPA